MHGASVVDISHLLSLLCKPDILCPFCSSCFHLDSFSPHHGGHLFTCVYVRACAGVRHHCLRDILDFFYIKLSERAKCMYHKAEGFRRAFCVDEWMDVTGFYRNIWR